MTTQDEYQRAIEGWMTTIVQDGGIDRFDDLHIDQIDARWVRREHWPQGGLEAYRIALRLRDRHRLDLTVVLAFSLESGEQRRGVDFKTLNEFQAQLDWSPPSLYLFRPEREPWTQVGGEAIPIDAPALFETALEVKGCYYIEFKQPESTDYSRSVFVAG